MLRNLLFVLAICSSLIVKANVRDSIPNGLPVNIFHGWVEATTQFVNDSGTVFKFNDTASKVKYGYGAIKFFTDHKPYYWDGTGWRGFAVPITGFVQYSDSTGGTYVTLTRLKDSLGNYVTLHTNQTNIDGEKTFGANATFNDTATISAVLKMTVPKGSIDRWGYNDSVQNIDPDGVFIFSDRINNLNSTASKNRSAGNLVTIRHQLLLDKQQDTLNLKSTTASAINITTNFRRNSAVDTVNVIGAVTTFPLKAASIGLEETSDTSLISHSYPYWNINLPYASVYTYAALANHGLLKEFDDLNIGSTTYIDAASDSANAITKRVGLHINSLNLLNTNKYAILQEGSTDSVVLNTQNIQFNNLKTTLTPAYRVLADASGNLLKKVYLPPVTATLDFPSTAAQTSSDLTVTVTGAAVGDVATVGWGNAPDEANSTYTARVSAANTVTVRFNNYSAGSINPTSGSFTVFVTPQ